jgi:hypothetical protein
MPLNESVTDKIRAYRSDYNNRPFNSISFIPVIAGTSGCLHSEFVFLLFLQAHRETDRFFAVSGVQFAQSTSGLFHFLRVVFSLQLKTKVDSILTKSAVLRINFNIDGSPLFLGVPVPSVTQCIRDV